MDNPVFEAVIVPHRSLNQRGRLLLLGAIGAVCCLSAALFARLGAWPVGGFSGVELLLAIVLLHLNTREARASEMLILSEAELRILRIDPRGARCECLMNTAWLRAELQERPGRVSRLVLRAGGRVEEVAASLGEDAKQDLATALQAALHRLQHPRFENPQLQQ